jgi:hypothetical protein
VNRGARSCFGEGRKEKGDLSDRIFGLGMDGLDAQRNGTTIGAVERCVRGPR